MAVLKYLIRVIFIIIKKDRYIKIIYLLLIIWLKYWFIKKPFEVKGKLIKKSFIMG
jgi:hypothetical protein